MDRPSRVLAIALAAATCLVSTTALADHAPAIASDGLYIGIRSGPDTAVSFAYSFDYYLTRTRTTSIGPAAWLSLFGGRDGTDSSPFGQRQRFMLVVDVLDFKVELNSASWFRPYVLVGGGFAYASLAASTEMLDVTAATGGATVRGTRALPRKNEAFPTMALGFGADLFIGGGWALSALCAMHTRPSADSRVPLVWMDLVFGVRYGI